MNGLCSIKEVAKVPFPGKDQAKSDGNVLEWCFEVSSKGRYTLLAIKDVRAALASRCVMGACFPGLEQEMFGKRLKDDSAVLRGNAEILKKLGQRAMARKGHAPAQER